MPYIVGDLDDVRDNWQGDGMYTDAQAVEKWLDEHEKKGYALIAVVPQYHVFDNEGEPDGLRDPLLIMHSDEATAGVFKVIGD